VTEAEPRYFPHSAVTGPFLVSHFDEKRDSRQILGPSLIGRFSVSPRKPIRRAHSSGRSLWVRGPPSGRRCRLAEKACIGRRWPCRARSLSGGLAFRAAAGSRPSELMALSHYPRHRLHRSHRSRGSSRHHRDYCRSHRIGLYAGLDDLPAIVGIRLLERARRP